MSMGKNTKVKKLIQKITETRLDIIGIKVPKDMGYSIKVFNCKELKNYWSVSIKIESRIDKVKISKDLIKIALEIEEKDLGKEER